MSLPKPAGPAEKVVEVPWARLDPETLRNLVQEFVTRDGADWGEAGGTLAGKVARVMQQLRNGKAKVVFELRSQSANIVVGR